MTFVTGRKLPRSISTRLVVQHLRGLHHLAAGGEHDRIRQSLFHQLQAHQPVIHVAERRAGELDHVHFHPAAAQIVHQRSDEMYRIVREVKRAINQIHTCQAQRFLLLDGDRVEHFDVQNQFRDLAPWLGLESNAEPAVPRCPVRVRLRGGSVREHEECGLLAAGLIEALHQALEFMIQHGFQALAADIVLGRAIHSIADGHVISGYRLGDGAGPLACLEKPADHLLAGANLCKCAVLARVVIDL